MVEDPRHQEALQALGVHSVEIAHELRNLLHRVLSIAECIDTKDLPPKTADALLTLLGGAKACRFLVDDLLTWGRGVGEPAVEFEVAPFLDDTLAMSGLREDRSIELKCVVPAEARAHARPERLRRAILNLLRNARQALADLDLGGRILVTAEMLDDQRLRIFIEDDGPGIDESLHDRLFEPFVTGKSSGTGLGLALARRIVQEDAGQLSLDSTGASGTRFVIELPTRSAAPPREPDAAARAPRPGLNLLVVDDDPNLLETFSLVLSLDGHRTHTAASAQAALEAISSLDFDCVISDLRLPDQSGVELYRGACELQPELAQRFVFATGDIQNADSRHFMDHCGLPCLIKPFEIEDLRQVLARVTSRAGGPS